MSTLESSSEEVGTIRHVLQGLITSYILGWAILIANVGNVPLVTGGWWQIGAAICMTITLWLGITMTVRALTWWVSTVLVFVTIRSFAYVSEGIFNPLGVWLLFMTGVSITALAVISLNALTGRLEKPSR